MTKDTNTLDARIRAKALKALEDRISEVSRPLKREIGNCMKQVYPGLYNKKGELLSAGTALQMVVLSVVAGQAEREQDAAVQNFITKVDGLQNQLDELSHHIDN